MECVTKPDGQIETIVILGDVLKPLKTCRGACLGMKNCKAASYHHRTRICQLYFDDTEVRYIQSIDFFYQYF